jgi:hypothetical protein
VTGGKVEIRRKRLAVRFRLCEQSKFEREEKKTGKLLVSFRSYDFILVLLIHCFVLAYRNPALFGTSSEFFPQRA